MAINWRKNRWKRLRNQIKKRDWLKALEVYLINKNWPRTKIKKIPWKGYDITKTYAVNWFNIVWSKWI